MTCLFSLLYGKNVTYITIPNSETFLYELKQVLVEVLYRKKTWVVFFLDFYKQIITNIFYNPIELNFRVT